MTAYSGPTSCPGWLSFFSAAVPNFTDSWNLHLFVLLGKNWQSSVNSGWCDSFRLIPCSLLHWKNHQKVQYYLIFLFYIKIFIHFLVATGEAGIPCYKATVSGKDSVSEWHLALRFLTGLNFISVISISDVTEYLIMGCGPKGCPVLNLCSEAQKSLLCF